MLAEWRLLMMKRRKCLNISAIIIGIVLMVAIFLPFLDYVAIQHNGDYVLKSLANGNIDFEQHANVSQVDSEISSMSVSNDEFTDTQWYISNPGYYINYTYGYNKKVNSVSDVDMNLVEAWKSSKDSNKLNKEVVVAIVDTGVDYQHPDLADNMWVNKEEIPNDNVDNDGNGYIDDIYGWDFYNKDASICHYDNKKGKKIASVEDNDNHGTHIAGIIAAKAGNEIGIAGVASNINIKIMALKINGGENGSGKMSDAIKAIKYASMMGADICNLSWGTTEYSSELKEAMKESDMLFIAAAGNSGKDNDEESLYPANFEMDNLITVTSIDARGELNSYSNYGEKSVDIAAPGNDIFSTIVGDYASMSGSSMAAPQVAAVAAMLYAVDDHIYASDVKSKIIGNLKSIVKLKGKIKNAGIPDAYKILEDSGKLVKDNKAPTMSFDTLYRKKVMTVPINIDDSGKSKVRVIKWIYGKKTVQDFKRGVSGTLVKNNQVSISDAGFYTFYASDYAGNESVAIYEVVADTLAPKLSISYTISDNYKNRTVKVKATDLHSGINRMKYMPGVKKAKDFIAEDAGIDITIKNNQGSFQVKKDGVYTIYAADYKGNRTVKTITIKTVKTTKLTFERSNIKLSVGKQIDLKLNINPYNSTDKIIYTSLNEKVATVSSTGNVTAIAKGTAGITAKTPSGVLAICIITVNTDG